MKAVIATLLALTTTASAETAPPEPVSENTAFALSLGGTVLSYGMIAGGIALEQPALTTAGVVGSAFAPSAGHWYSHKAVSRGLGMRAAGIGLGVLGIAAIPDFDQCSVNCDSNGGLETTVVLVLAGVGMYVAGTVHDVITSRRAARRFNSRIERVSVVPTANAHGGGLSVVGAF